MIRSDGVDFKKDIYARVNFIELSRHKKVVSVGLAKVLIKFFKPGDEVRLLDVL